ncbi:MAG: septum formation initiator family protein [Armatimonadota bacterium]
MAYRGAQKGRSPVSRGKRRNKGLIAVIGRWVLVGVICLVAGKLAFSFGGKVVMLAQEAYAQRKDIAALRAETERLREQNAALREEMRKLNTPGGIVLEARKQGYGFPGEKLLVVAPPRDSSLRSE